MTEHCPRYVSFGQGDVPVRASETGSVEVVLEDEAHVARRALQRRRAERADRVEAVRTMRYVHARPVSENTMVIYFYLS